MIEERLRVLKAMSEVTHSIDLNAFAGMVGLSPEETIEEVHELVNSGHFRRVGGGFGITEEGKNVLKAIEPVSSGKEFHFYTGIDQPTGFSAANLKEFYEITKRVPLDSLQFHLFREDFENWIKKAVKDEELANELSSLREMNVEKEEIRTEIMKTIAKKYGNGL